MGEKNTQKNRNGQKTTIKGKNTGTKTQPKRNYKVTQH